MPFEEFMVMSICIGELKISICSIISDFSNDLPVIESNTDLGGPYSVAEVLERNRHPKNVEVAQEVRRKPVPRTSKHSSDQEVDEGFNFFPATDSWPTNEKR